jgi:hypothetical protein
MLLAGFFAGCLFAALIVGDWWWFSRSNASAGRYGCPVARAEDILPVESKWTPASRFDPNGLLPLDHGAARFFPDECCILLRPHASRFSSRFRTAWSLKGTIAVQECDGMMRLHCVKLMPWSSALLTLLWFAVVSIGTLAFVVRFLASDDAFSLGSLLLVLGVTAVGLLVLVFGLVTVSLAYRLEDQRLMQVYQELRVALAGTSLTPQLDVKSDRK